MTASRILEYLLVEDLIVKGHSYCSKIIQKCHFLVTSLSY